MILDDKQLEPLVYLVPGTYGRLWKVFVGDLLVYVGHNQVRAEAIVDKFRSAVLRALKAEVMELASEFCDRCGKERPKKRKTKAGLRVLHYDKSLGWQPCDADFLWLALLHDTIERKQNGIQKTDKEHEEWRSLKGKLSVADIDR